MSEDNTIENDIFSEGYGIMPMKLKRDRSIHDKAKLLYLEISALCAEKGYCWAGNDYLAEITGVNETTISAYLTELSDYLYFENRYNQNRKIYLRSSKTNKKLSTNGAQPSPNSEGAFCKRRSRLRQTAKPYIDKYYKNNNYKGSKHENLKNQKQMLTDKFSFI